MSEQISTLLKILVIGESAVGKSALLLRYIDNVFTQTFMTTIGVDFKNKVIDIDGNKVKLQIWDTAGQEKFRAITKAYYRGAHGILVVFDISNVESFHRTSAWLDSIKNENCDIEVLLIGNKADLERAVSKEEAEGLAEKYDIPYFETSAKEDKGVTEAFEKLAYAAYKRYQNAPHDKGTKKLDAPQSEDNKKGCC
ncbi:small GTP-binding protein, putative [Trichomonas vaginalis G3]|uniref:Small GTP-binding protein, putative n=1 Tax=Trichomonas vaginalis (strain ATCC PRA-98 / G3) TaxID=412133 RepID=A2DYD3_TRIV3|nr:GTPase protein [Trichomonas vaginalis G3]EAY14610.1 small GTP-binding protein, putative [Trichomonas vaginalis G3]KAI5526621.1 GTPase protein [Trichomonas vaginalis G3]|eukprot:XP_001326833.1 small GTP-binding protein [Trichomonas vaginalis G3]